MSEWIKCSERLPEKDGRYLVYEPWDHWFSIGVCSLRDGRWDIARITHWRELPNRPEENS